MTPLFKVGSRTFDSLEDAEKHADVLDLKYKMDRQGLSLCLSEVELFSNLFPVATKGLRAELIAMEEYDDG